MKKTYFSMMSIVMMAVLSVCFISCSKDDAEEESSYSGDLSNILSQYGWTSDYNDNYLIGDDYINVTTDAGTLFFLENGEGIERYERHDYDSDFGSSSKTTPVPFTYTVNGSIVTINWPSIRSVSYSHSESYRYKNGALIPLDENVVSGYKSNSILSSDRKWLEDAKYYVMDDDERLNIDITLKFEPKGSDNDGNYIYEFHMTVPASAKAEARKISTVRATFWYPDNNKDRVTLIISGNNTDSSVSGYMFVKESSLPGTMQVKFEAFDNKNAYAYKFIKSTEYELTVDDNSNDDNDNHSSPLTITTENVDLTPPHADLSGHISGTDSRITVGFIYGTNKNLSESRGIKTETLYMASDGDFTIRAMGLPEGTTYYYRSYAIVDGEYHFGEIKSFTTPTTAPYTYVIDGKTYGMVLVEGGTMPPFYIMQTEMPISNLDDDGDGIIIVAECMHYIRTLSEQVGKPFRLPTQEEWEYAARGGQKSIGYIYSGSNSIEDVAWYSGNSGNSPHPFASKEPNELGIYDMSGNYAELCRPARYSEGWEGDLWGDILCGGSWKDSPSGCRTSSWKNKEKGAKWIAAFDPRYISIRLVYSVREE